mmetsp:Transcript_33267/g.76777  ORF Transcript_33267/g.76777 Transcript_33267/m.76777 type:complete len:82 (+) Transcript_33267:179-424(+)
MVTFVIQDLYGHGVKLRGILAQSVHFFSFRAQISLEFHCILFRYILGHIFILKCCRMYILPSFLHHTNTFHNIKSVNIEQQ